MEVLALDFHLSRQELMGLESMSEVTGEQLSATFLSVQLLEWQKNGKKYNVSGDVLEID